MNFGVFNSFWDSRPNHLPFLDMINESQEEADRLFSRLVEQWPEGVPLPEPTPPEERFSLSSSISLLEKILTNTEIKDLKVGYSLLLNETDWRAHIVASLFAAMLYKSKGLSWAELLWKRLNEGSWTSPQLCVVLSYIDSDFEKHAKEIISAGGRVVYSEELTALQSHVKRGPAGKIAEDRKFLQALQYLVDGAISSENEDNNGGAIAQDWKTSFLKFIQDWTL